MPQTLSAKKRLRQNANRLLANRGMKREIKTRTKTFTEAISEKDLDRAQELFKIVISRIDKANKNNVIHKNKAARMKSKLSLLLNSLQG